METAYICVDIEAAGPHPGGYSLLSLGAALVTDPQQHFYIELQPINAAQTEEAQSVHGLSLEALVEGGSPPAESMQRFADWLIEVCGDQQPVFVAFNAPFDWMFVADYFQTFLGRNPFGHSALDIKALFMGLQGVAWEETSYQMIASHYSKAENLPHNALEDAIQEAEIFAELLKDLKEKEDER